MEVSDEEVWCECSDEEMYNPGKEKKGTWQPKAEDILKLFDELKTKKVLELKWKCPGRRHPDSDKKPDEDVKEVVVQTPTKVDEQRPNIPNEFDFDDDANESKTVLIPRKTPGSAPKSVKKVARMNKVLKDVMQQRKIQAAEKEARKQAGQRSPRTPGSPARARIGSPAGSPRTPPAVGLNRQSPVRAAGPGDSISTTPHRAHLEPHSLQKNLAKDSDKHLGIPTTPKSDLPNLGPNSKPLPFSPVTPSNSQNQHSQIHTQASLFSQSQPKAQLPVKPTDSATPVPHSTALSSSQPASVHPASVATSSVQASPSDKIEKMDTT